MDHHPWKLIPVCAMAAALAGYGPAHAEGPDAGGNARPTLQELEAKLKQQEEQLAQQLRALDAQEKRLKEYKQTLDRLLAEQKLRRQELNAYRAAGAPQAGSAGPAAAGATRPGDEAQQIAQNQASPAPAPTAPVGEAPQRQTKPPEVAPITDAVTVLTPPGRFVLEPSLQYAHSSDSRVTLVGFTIIPALTIGLIDVRSINRDLFIGALTGRYGVTDRLELEARVPWVYRSDSTVARPLATPAATDSAFDTSGSGLGDIEVAARYQITQRPPFFIGSLRLKTRTGEGPFEVKTTTIAPGLTVEDELPTGTGFYALQPGVTVLVPSDPAVFFGGLSYIWNIKRTINKPDLSGNRIGSVDPGDGINFNFGMGLAINERSSFSIGYDNTTFLKDQQNGRNVLNAEVRQLGSLLFGLSYRLTPRTSLNLTLGAGLTEEAPDVQIIARLPLTF